MADCRHGCKWQAPSFSSSIVGKSGMDRVSCPQSNHVGVSNGDHLSASAAVSTFADTSFTTRGTVNAFGVFQTYYTSPESPWRENASNVSWIGSTQASLLLFVGVLSGPVYDAGYFRHLIMMGSILIPLGFMMTSLANNYWQVMLAQAFCIGLGNGCIFIPSVAILPQYFSTKKALANGLAASGSSIGGIIYPIVFRRLQQQIGFAWATRVLGFIALVTLWFSVLVMRPRIKPKGKRKLWDFSALKETPYLLFCFAMFTGYGFNV